MHHVETHNGPVVHTGGYLHVQGANHNPPETIVPKLGTGVELLYVKDDPNPAAANGYGLLQAYSRDRASFRPLYIHGDPLYLEGNVRLPAGSAQALIGQWHQGSGWRLPASSQWLETDVRASSTWSGAPLRIEWQACVQVVGHEAIYVGLGIDGSLTWANEGAWIGAASGDFNTLTGVMYHVSVTPGVHRISLWLYGTAGAGMYGGNNSSIWVTEQRA